MPSPEGEALTFVGALVLMIAVYTVILPSVADFYADTARNSAYFPKKPAVFTHKMPNLRSSLNLDKFQFKDESAVGRNVVHLH